MYALLVQGTPGLDFCYFDTHSTVARCLIDLSETYLPMVLLFLKLVFNSVASKSSTGNEMTVLTGACGSGLRGTRPTPHT